MKQNSFFKSKYRYQFSLMLFLLLLTITFQNCGRRYLPPALNDSSDNSSLDLIGSKLYTDNCFACHGSMESSTVDNRSVNGIQSAILNQSQMQFISLSEDDISHIVSALNFSNADSSLNSIKSKSTYEDSFQNEEETYDAVMESMMNEN